MVNENLVNLVNNKKAQIEEVREIENTEQQQKKLDEKQEYKPTITENVKKVIVPKVHASDDDDDYDDLEAKIVHVDTIKEAKQHNADEFRKMERDATEGDCKIL